LVLILQFFGHAGFTGHRFRQFIYKKALPQPMFGIATSSAARLARIPGGRCAYSRALESAKPSATRDGES
jgi:hypothetical protein